MRGARPDCVSEEAKRRQRDQVGTLGSGNHYLEVQRVTDIYDENAAEVFGLRRGEVVVSIHCGSRGLGHQIGTDYLAVMAAKAQEWGIRLPERDLACAPIRSEIGERYLGAMRAGMNSAMANRQVLTALTRQVFANYFAGARLPLLYDVSHNTCKEETHEVDGRERQLFVHRKGDARLWPGAPRHPRGFSWGRPAGHRRREHGDLLVRLGGEHGEGLAVAPLRLPRRGARGRAQRGDAPLERQGGRRANWHKKES